MCWIGPGGTVAVRRGGGELLHPPVTLCLTGRGTGAVAPHNGPAEWATGRRPRSIEDAPHWATGSAPASSRRQRCQLPLLPPCRCSRRPCRSRRPYHRHHCRLCFPIVVAEIACPLTEPTVDASPAWASCLLMKLIVGLVSVAMSGSETGIRRCV